MPTTWNAADYAKNSTAQQKLAREVLAKFHLHGTERVLDIGCGDGKVTAELAAMLPAGSVLGVDSSADMVRFAAEQFRGISNLKFQIADAGSLNFDHEFDAIFSNAALHWIFDHRPVLAGISRSLKRGGKLLAQMGGKGNVQSMLDAVGRVISQPRWAEYFTDMTFRYGFHGPEEYRRWLLEAGLQPLRVELLDRDTIHPGVEGLAGWIRTAWTPWISRVPVESREDFLMDVTHEHLKIHPIDSAGLAHVPMTRLEVEAIKI